MVKLYNSVNEPDATKPPKMRRGVAPNPSQQPVVFGTVLDSVDGTLWRLAWIRLSIGTPNSRKVKPVTAGNAHWYHCKLYVDGRAPHKANYWLSVNPSESRISSRWDAKTMLEYRPNLYKAVVHLLAWLAKDQDARDHLDEGTVFAVRSVGDTYAIDEQPSPARAAFEAEQSAQDLALAMKQLPVGGVYPSMADRNVINMAARMLAATGMQFAGPESLIGGTDITRVK